MLCSWSVKATLLDAKIGDWTSIPLLATSEALQSLSEIHSIQASPDPNCYITVLENRICLVARKPGDYEVCLKFSVSTTVTISRNTLLRQFTAPAPTSPETVIVLHGMTDAKVVAQKSDKDICSKILLNANPPCTVPPCDRISVCWGITPEDIAHETTRLLVSSINAKWTVEPKRMKGEIDIEVSTEKDFFSEEADNAMVDLSLWLGTKESSSVLKVVGSRVMGWSHTNSTSTLSQRMIVQLRLPSTADSFPVEPAKFSVLVELPISLSSEYKPCTIPLITSTSQRDVAQGAFREQGNVNILTWDPTVQLRQLPHEFSELEIQETDVTQVPVLAYTHPLTAQSSNVPTTITFDAIQHRSKIVKALPIFVETVESTVDLARIAESEKRALVNVSMKLLIPTIFTGDRKGESDYLASSWCKIVIGLRHISSATAEPIQLLTITANGEKINTARLLQDHSKSNVTKLCIPLLLLPPAPLIQQQTQPPPSPRSVLPMSYGNHYDGAHVEGDSAHGAGRIVHIRFGYTTEVDGVFDGNEGCDRTATLPLPSFDVQVGKHVAFIYVNDDPPYAIDVSAVPSDAQMEVGGKKINFNEIQNSFESSFADHMPFNSITCNPERKFSGNRFEGGLGLSACYETSKVTALMRDQISGLGKRDKGAENGDSARDKGDVAAKGPPKEIEFEDGSQEVERDGTGGSLDINPIKSGKLSAFEAVILPPNMLVAARIKIGGKKYSENVLAAAMGDGEETKNDIPPPQPTVRLVRRQPYSPIRFFATLAAMAFVVLFTIAVRIELGESPQDYRFVIDEVQKAFERKGGYGMRT